MKSAFVLRQCFDGDGFNTMDESVKLELIDYYPLDKDFILNYRVLND